MTGGDQLVSDVPDQSELLFCQLYNVVNVKYCKMKLLEMCHFLPENVSICSKFYYVKY